MIEHLAFVGFVVVVIELYPSGVALAWIDGAAMTMRVGRA
jgi:hypothetical protein